MSTNRMAIVGTNIHQLQLRHARPCATRLRSAGNPLSTRAMFSFSTRPHRRFSLMLGSSCTFAAACALAQVCRVGGVVIERKGVLWMFERGGFLIWHMEVIYNMFKVTPRKQQGFSRSLSNFVIPPFTLQKGLAQKPRRRLAPFSRTIATHVVHVEAQLVTQAVRHEVEHQACRSSRAEPRALPRCPRQLREV